MLGNPEYFALNLDPGLWNPDYSSRNPESHQRSGSGIQVPVTENPESNETLSSCRNFLCSMNCA